MNVAVTCVPFCPNQFIFPLYHKTLKKHISGGGGQTSTIPRHSYTASELEGSCQESALIGGILMWHRQLSQENALYFNTMLGYDLLLLSSSLLLEHCLRGRGGISRVLISPCHLYVPISIFKPVDLCSWKLAWTSVSQNKVWLPEFTILTKQTLVNIRTEPSAVTQLKHIKIRRITTTWVHHGHRPTPESGVY